MWAFILFGEFVEDISYYRETYPDRNPFIWYWRSRWLRFYMLCWCRNVGTLTEKGGWFLNRLYVVPVAATKCIYIQKRKYHADHVFRVWRWYVLINLWQDAWDIWE